jgi:hypothetical protein
MCCYFHVLRIKAWNRPARAGKSFKTASFVASEKPCNGLYGMTWCCQRFGQTTRPRMNTNEAQFFKRFVVQQELSQSCHLSQGRPK